MNEIIKVNYDMDYRGWSIERALTEVPRRRNSK